MKSILYPLVFTLLLGGCGAADEVAGPAAGRWLGAQRIDGSPPALSRASTPSLAIDRSGRAVVVWTREQTLLANRFVPGRGWNNPENVTPTPQYAGSAIIAMSDSGEMMVVWFGAAANTWRVWASRSGPAGGWSEPVAIDGGAAQFPRQLAATMDAAGNAVVLWASGRTPDGIVAARYVANQGWMAPERLSAIGAAPAVASRAAGQAVAAWGEFGTTVAATYEEGRGWSGRTRFEPAPGWQAMSVPVLAVDSFGRALLAWESRYGDGNGPAVAVAASFDGLAWTDQFVVSDPGVKSYRPAVALRNRDGLVVWTWLGSGASASGGVAFSRFTFDPSFDSPSRIPSGAYSNEVGAALSRSGEGFAAWVGTEPEPISGDLRLMVWASRYAGGMWGLTQPLQTGPGSAQYPQIAVDDDGNAIVVWAEDEVDSTRIWSNRFEIDSR
jgi:hypothetical protein